MINITSWFSLLIIAVILIGVSLGRYPILRMNRATIAFVGAAVLIMIGSISIEQAFAAIDLNTILLLFSIMILNVNFRLCGFFHLISNQILKFAKTPRQLLALLVISSGILSALFLNDTIVLVFTPITLEITHLLKRNPIPYLIALATSANVGSVATVIGNPQNIIIGISSNISFTKFALYLAPVAGIGLFTIWIIIILFYKEEFKRAELTSACLPKFRIYQPLLRKSTIAAIIMVGALMFGAPISIAAMGAASLLLVTRRLKAERVFAEIDWSLLVFFASLFVVTKTIETIGFSNQLINIAQIKSGSEIVDLAILSTVSSNLISNVPAVLLLRTIINTYSNITIAWLTMAMATTFAGNLTLLGSVANLIVAESAKKQGVILHFKEYLKIGLPITLATIFWGIIWLNLFYGN
jgi:Na+/H+ antiporter NhaD/arsenite permease-like protein